MYPADAFNNYGSFTGARHDEENLLHLGGQGPYTGAPAILDLLRGGTGAGPGFWHP